MLGVQPPVSGLPHGDTPPTALGILHWLCSFIRTVMDVSVERGAIYLILIYDCLL